MPHRKAQFAEPGDVVMAGPRLARLRRLLLQWVLWLAALAAVVYLWNYVDAAQLLMAKAPSCQWDTFLNPTNPSYSARLCYLTRHRAMLRLYDATGRHLLAERDFFELDRTNVYWESDALVYNGDYYDGGEIALPPTFIDRLRAKLP